MLGDIGVNFETSYDPL